MKDRSLRGVQVLLVFVVIVWGASYPLVKLLLMKLGTMELVLARFWICCPPLIGLALRYRKEIVDLLRRHTWRVLLLGLLGVPGYHLTFNTGTRLLTEDPTSAGSAAMLASILVASAPAWIALFAHIARMEYLSIRQWLGQLLALAGVVLIASRGDFEALRFSAGALWVLGAPVSWALYSLVARPILKRQASSLPLICCAMLFGTLALSPFAPSDIGSHLAALGTLDWVYLVFVALLSTFAGYLIWGLAIRRMEATKASTYIYFIPLISITVAILLARENLTALVVLGGGLILAGVLLIQRGR
jgi:drug/metabolite transporter (DMT)-like permease